MLKLGTPVIFSGELVFYVEDAAYCLRQAIIHRYDAEGSRIVRALRNVQNQEQALKAEARLHDWISKNLAAVCYAD